MPASVTDVHLQLREAVAIGPAFLMLKVTEAFNDLEALGRALRRHEAAGKYLFHILVSEDVDMKDPIMRLWGWFTRFDPAGDLYPAGRDVRGNRLAFEFPILIDARWKKGYPRPVEFDPEIEKRVNARWNSYGISSDLVYQRADT